METKIDTETLKKEGKKYNKLNNNDKKKEVITLSLKHVVQLPP